MPIEVPVLLGYLETGPAVCSIYTNITKIIGRENVGPMKDGLLLGGEIPYLRLLCLSCHSYITATALCKQVPACVRNIL